jgi:hypothetical protein
MAWFIVEPSSKCRINVRKKLVEHCMDLMSHCRWELCLMQCLKLKKDRVEGSLLSIHRVDLHTKKSYFPLYNRLGKGIEQKFFSKGVYGTHIVFVNGIVSPSRAVTLSA